MTQNAFWFVFGGVVAMLVSRFVLRRIWRIAWVLAGAAFVAVASLAFNEPAIMARCVAVARGFWTLGTP